MKYLLNVQSFTDIITNSSSEIFLLNSDISTSEIKNMIQQHVADYHEKCTGMGGIIEVYTLDQYFIDDLEYGIYCNDTDEFYTLNDFSKEELYHMYITGYQKDCPTLQITGNTIIIDIDNGFRSAIEDLIIKQFNAIRID